MGLLVLGILTTSKDVKGPDDKWLPEWKEYFKKTLKSEAPKLSKPEMFQALAMDGAAWLRAGGGYVGLFFIRNPLVPEERVFGIPLRKLEDTSPVSMGTIRAAENNLKVWANWFGLQGDIQLFDIGHGMSVLPTLKDLKPLDYFILPPPTTYNPDLKTEVKSTLFRVLPSLLGQYGINVKVIDETTGFVTEMKAETPVIKVHR